MNTTTPTDGRITPPRLATGRAAVARLLALAVAGLTLCFTSLFAEVIDDFEGPVKFAPWSEGIYYLEPDLVDGELVFSGQYPASQPGSPFKDQNFNSVFWTSSLSSGDMEGRTLELRVDLVSTSADDVFFYLGVSGPSHSNFGGYEIGIDQNELYLVKYQWIDNHAGDIASLFWVTTPFTNQNVTAVLAATQMTDAVLLTTKLIDKGTGTILFEKRFVDGPGVEVQAPTVFPKGWTFLVADWGAPITNLDSVFTGVFQYAPTAPPPLQVVVDNLEYDVYDSPALTVSSSGQGLVFSWPVSSTSFELESAPSLSPEAVWETIPTTPIVDGDRQTVTLDATVTAQFFRLKQSP